MIMIYADGTLVFSAQPGGANTTLTLEALRNPLDRDSYQGFALLEFEAIDREVYVDVSVPQGDPNLALYGQLEDIHVEPTKRKPVGLRCNIEAKDDGLSGLPSFIVVEMKDSAGTALGTLKFQFICQPVSRQGLFRFSPAGSPRVEPLPQLICEPALRKRESFKLLTLQQGTSFVSYALGAAQPAGAPYMQSLVQSASSYVHSDGPLLDTAYVGGPGNVGDAQVFMVEGSLAGRVQRIPFISWIADTPGRGELVIAAVEPDPRGADRGKEHIMLQNTGARMVNLAGCTIEDEQRMAIFGLPLNLPSTRAGRYVVPRGTRLRPGDTVRINPNFTMNNDFDAFQLRNRLGRPLDFSAYIRRLPGTPPPAVPRQRVIFRTTVSLDNSTDQVAVTLQTPLEDGDLVVIRPDPTSRLWAGDFFHPPTGPEGGLSAPALPANWVLPLPTAPVYALLMISSPEPRLVGNVTQVVVIDRESKARNGLIAGTRSIAFERNDIAFNRPFAWGQFDIEVIVLRH